MRRTLWVTIGTKNPQKIEAFQDSVKEIMERSICQAYRWPSFTGIQLFGREDALFQNLVSDAGKQGRVILDMDFKRITLRRNTRLARRSA
jgi:hypothetical protein